MGVCKSMFQAKKNVTSFGTFHTEISLDLTSWAVSRISASGTLLWSLRASQLLTLAPLSRFH